MGTGWATPGAWRWPAIVGVTVLVAACAAQETWTPANRDLVLADHLFSVGYRDISDIYIDDVAIADLAVAGLAGLSAIDPGVAVARTGERITVSLPGHQAGIFPVPGPTDYKGWAKLTASALNFGRSRSSELLAAKPERLYEVVFDGLLGKLDRFSRYSGREEARENRASRDGFGGIGVRIRQIENGVRILSVMDNTPAERAGLHDDDIIVEIDGKPTVGLAQRELVRRLRGPLNSVVTLTVERDSAPDALSIHVVRAHVVPQTVRYTRLGTVAHIRISGFNQRTTRSLRAKMKLAALDIGPQLAGFVLDLRGNPGGLLDQAVAVSDLFVTSGEITVTHGRHPDSHQYFDAEPEDVAGGKAIIVLVDGNSASASEIVAAALQDSGRAVVIGTSSFGKGTVQTVLRLPNEGELTLTWAQFHAPSGYGISGRGVMPNICTAGASADQVLDRLRRETAPSDLARLRQHLDPRDSAGIEAFRAWCPPGESDFDADLEIARRLIEDPVLYALALGTTARGTAQADSNHRVIASHLR